MPTNNIKYNFHTTFYFRQTLCCNRVLGSSGFSNKIQSQTCKLNLDKLDDKTHCVHCLPLPLYPSKNIITTFDFISFERRLVITYGKPLFFALALTLEGSACNMRPYSSQCSLSSAYAYPEKNKCNIRLLERIYFKKLSTTFWLEYKFLFRFLCVTYAE